MIQGQWAKEPKAGQQQNTLSLSPKEGEQVIKPSASGWTRSPEEDQGDGPAQQGVVIQMRRGFQGADGEEIRLGSGLCCLPLPHHKLMRRSGGARLENQEQHQEKPRGGRGEVC